MKRMWILGLPALIWLAAFSSSALADAFSIPNVKARMAEIGCFDGPLDESRSLAFRTAARCVQRALGVEPTGQLTEMEIEALMTKDDLVAPPSPPKIAVDEEAEAKAARTRLLLQPGRSVRETGAGGTVLHVGEPACRGHFMIDLTASSSGTAHVYRRLRATRPYVLDCPALEERVGEALEAALPQTRRVVVFVLDGWDGHDPSPVANMVRAIIVSDVVSPHLGDAVRTVWDGEHANRPDPRRFLSIELDNSLAIKYADGLDLPRDLVVAPHLAGAAAAIQDRLWEQIGEVRAARSRAAQRAATAEVVERSDPTPHCREAAGRLGECRTEWDTWSGAYNVTCGGSLAGSYVSPASRCRPLAGLWCDLSTGRMFPSRDAGLQAICPRQP